MFRLNYKGGHVLILLLLGMCFSCNVERLEGELPLEDISNRQENGCQLVVNGQISDTRDLTALENVELSSDLFTEPIMTDADGKFSVILFFDAEEDSAMGEIEVSADGFLAKTIEVDLGNLLGNCGFLTEVDWQIGLSPKQPAIELSTTSSTSATVSNQHTVAIYNENEDGELVLANTTTIFATYDFIFPAVSGTDNPSICVSPDHSFARGAGIAFDRTEQGLPLANLVVDASEGLTLNGPIQVTLSPDLPISNSDVLSVSNGSITSFNSADNSLTLLITSLGNISLVNNNGCVVTTFSASIGQQRSRQSLSNCQCGAPQSFVFSSPFTPFSRLNIALPEGMSAMQAALITDNLRNCLNINSSTVDTGVGEGINVVADKCESVTLETRNIIRTYRGEILGIAFSYFVSSELETQLVTSDCPTTSSCHQGCP